MQRRAPRRCPQLTLNDACFAAMSRPMFAALQVRACGRWRERLPFERFAALSESSHTSQRQSCRISTNFPHVLCPSTVKAGAIHGQCSVRWTFADGRRLSNSGNCERRSESAWDRGRLPCGRRRKDRGVPNSPKRQRQMRAHGSLRLARGSSVCALQREICLDLAKQVRWRC